MFKLEKISKNLWPFYHITFENRAHNTRRNFLAYMCKCDNLKKKSGDFMVTNSSIQRWHKGFYFM